MPLYVYAGPSCGARFERLVPMSCADEVPACPDCGSAQTRRAITAAAMVGACASPAASPSAARSPFT
jgi:putative FmdB family regulatory protein